MNCFWYIWRYITVRSLSAGDLTSLQAQNLNAKYDLNCYKEREGQKNQAHLSNTDINEINADTTEIKWSHKTHCSDLVSLKKSATSIRRR